MRHPLDRTRDLTPAEHALAVFLLLAVLVIALDAALPPFTSEHSHSTACNVDPEG